MAWDEQSISTGFLRIAEEAERYLREVRGKMKGRPAYEHVFGDHLAKFYVFNYLHSRTFLASRAGLVQELRRLLETPIVPPPREVFEPERFERHRRNYIQQLIDRYEHDDR